MATPYKSRSGNGWYIGNSDGKFIVEVQEIVSSSRELINIFMSDIIMGNPFGKRNGYIIPGLDEIKSLFPGMPKGNDSVLFFNVFDQSVPLFYYAGGHANISGYIIGRKGDEEVSDDVKVVFNQFSEKNKKSPKIVVADLGYQYLADFMNQSYHGFGVLG